MVSFEDIAADKAIKEEYRKAFLLNIFKKIVAKMKNDKIFATNIKTLFKQSTNKCITTKVIVSNNLKYEMSESDTELMYTWFRAYMNKSDRRKVFTEEFRQSLYERQKGLCAVCGEPLKTDLSKNHVDYIIPWSLVGDELPDNYQFLCSSCNESKSCHIDYIFKNLLKLN